MNPLVSPLLTNIVSGIIVGILQLYIEYRFFQPWPPQASLPRLAFPGANTLSAFWKTPRIIMSMTLVVLLGSLVSLFIVSKPEIELASLIVSSAVYLGLIITACLILKSANDTPSGMSSVAGLALGLVVAVIYILRHLDNYISQISLSLNSSMFFVLGIAVAFSFVPAMLQSLNNPSAGLLVFGLSATSLISLYNLLWSRNTQNLSIWLAWGIVVGLLVFAIVCPKLFLLFFKELGMDV